MGNFFSCLSSKYNKIQQDSLDVIDDDLNLLAQNTEYKQTHRLNIQYGI